MSVIAFAAATADWRSEDAPARAMKEALDAAPTSYCVRSSPTSPWRVVSSPAPSDEVGAWAKLSDAIDSVGWMFLEVHSTAGLDDAAQVFAAGFLEGFLTAARVAQFTVNVGANATLDPKVSAFLDANEAWVRAQAAAKDAEPFWHQVGLVYAQLDGLVAGYGNATAGNASATLPVWAFRNFQVGGDLEDIEAALGVDSDDALSSAESSAADFALRRSHCSGLVKLLADRSDLFISQVTWSDLNSMMRIYKLYDLPVQTSGQAGASLVPMQRAAFSSYPATLFSGDDFYTLSADEAHPVGIVGLETTIGNNNQTLYELYITPESVLEWVRTIVANRLGGDVNAWAEAFRTENSGTYNNQWILVDLRRFVPGQVPAANSGLVLVLEQLPGYVEFHDLSGFLAQNQYIPSYNVPMFPDVFNLSNNWPLVEQYGDWFTYNNTARANIFRRDHHKVVDLPSMQRLMRYNDFQNDPLATQGCTCPTCWPRSSAENAVSCRDDLNPANGTYFFSALGHRNHAAIDAKITSARMQAGALGGVPRFTSIISGPTYDQQPVFAFSTAGDFSTLPHVGLPDAWKFPWVGVYY